MTYNVAGCIGRQNQFNGERILEIVSDADADVVALQEVYDPRGGGPFLTELRSLGYSTMHFGPAVRDDSGHYGNALLIKESDCEIDELDLSVANNEPRSAIRARFQSGSNSFEVITTHLGLLGFERSLQIRRLSDWSNSKPKRTDFRIVQGDLNEWCRFSSREKEILSDFGYGPRIRTFPSRLPLFCLDRILVDCPENGKFRWWRLDGRKIRHASDHCPLLMELETQTPRLR